MMIDSVRLAFWSFSVVLLYCYLLLSFYAIAIRMLSNHHHANFLQHVIYSACVSHWDIYTEHYRIVM